ncbi:lipase [Stylonychia lemnae]|uniref:Lipase n=1 Tax=Stylonychia lemnae TaxID=5949 RepID=A0A078A5F2_STYLE|nr:lipase [Stylonychia lemnae]|eukprot:CDW77399.1 lipase [Stylonychia lemnae]
MISLGLIISGLVISTFVSLSWILHPGKLERGFTDHFQQWLDSSSFASQNFARTEFVGGSYGGKANAQDKIRNHPVIFIHGLTDIAVGTVGIQQGFSRSIEYFLLNGYKKSELYATTWGFGDLTESVASAETFNEKNVMYVRKFIEAVLQYTGAEKVDVIAHSMGGPLSRRAIKGGQVTNTIENFNVGLALTDSIDTYITIASPHYGVLQCYGQGNNPSLPQCSNQNGFSPAPSQFLKDLNDDPTREGDHIYSFASSQDHILTALTYDDFSKYTGTFPTVDQSYYFKTRPYSHDCMKDVTAMLQLQAVKFHNFNIDFDKMTENGKYCELYPY